jgi:hypothetical protein
MQKLIAKTLEQQGRNGCLGRRFNINAQNFIDIQIGLKNQAFRYPVNIMFLDPRPHDTTVLPWKWIVIAIVLTFITAALAYVYIIPLNMASIPDQYADVYNILKQWKTETLSTATVFMLVAILASLRKTQKFVILKTRYGQVAVVKFLKDVPNKQALDEFIRDIRFRSEQLTKKSKHNAEEILSAELDGLRNLRDHKIIGDADYNKAKKVIMKKHASLDRDAINKSRKNKLEIAQYH